MGDFITQLEIDLHCYGDCLLDLGPEYIIANSLSKDVILRFS